MPRDRSQQSVTDEAHAWRVLLADQPSPADQKEFETWLNKDPSHRRAYERAVRVWELVGKVDRPSDRNERRKLKRTAYLGSLAAGLAAAYLYFFIEQDNALVETASYVQEFVAKPGEIETIKLGDGSVVTLGGSSRLHFVGDVSTRRALLLHGDAFFEVASDLERPFAVEAGFANVRVVGTSFSVERDARETTVMVSSGNVSVVTTREIRSGESQDNPVSLNPGFSVSMTAEGAGIPVPVELSNIAAWRTGRLVLKAEPLGDVIKALNRYDEREISLGYLSGTHIPVTATFRLDDIDGSLLLLCELFNMEIDDSRTGHVLLVEKK